MKFIAIMMVMLILVSVPIIITGCAPDGLCDEIRPPSDCGGVTTTGPPTTTVDETLVDQE